MIATVFSWRTGPSLTLLLGLLLCALHETVAEQVAFYKSVSANKSKLLGIPIARSVLRHMRVATFRFVLSDHLRFLRSDLTFIPQFFASIGPCQRSLRQAIYSSHLTSHKTRAHIFLIIQGYA